MAAGDVVPALFTGPIAVLGSSNATIVSVPTSHQYTVKQIVICNTDSVDRWFSLGLEGTSATAANCFVYRMPIAGNDTVVLDTAIVIEASQVMSGMADSADKVNVLVTGWDRQTA